jgi:EAL domain-containing protein (putative c-di-GMP-specific phosphodiesterase class I)
VRSRLDQIKIDRWLVSQFDTDRERFHVVAALANFSDRTGALAVAEGVERKAEADTLRKFGVSLLQGY